MEIIKRLLRVLSLVFCFTVSMITAPIMIIEWILTYDSKVFLWNYKFLHYAMEGVWLDD